MREGGREGGRDGRKEAWSDGTNWRDLVGAWCVGAAGAICDFLSRFLSDNSSGNNKITCCYGLLSEAQAAADLPLTDYIATLVRTFYRVASSVLPLCCVLRIKRATYARGIV